MKIFTTCAAALLTSVAMAQVQSPPDTGPEPAESSAEAVFASLDRNKDERVSKAEAAADDGLSSQFAALDADADGYINKGEYIRAQQPGVPNPAVPTPPTPPLPTDPQS